VNRIWEFFLSRSRFQQIGIIVLTTHLAILFALTTHHLVLKREKPHRPIAIRTAIIRPTSQTTVAHPKKTAPKPKPVAAAKKAPEVRAKEPQVSQKTTSPVIDEGELRNLIESLEALSQPTPQKRSEIAIALPKKLEMQTSVESSSNAPSYGEMLAAILQSHLDLPELGEVVARIEINAAGAVISCEILSEKSHKNGEFLKKRLQEFSFPCFNEFNLTENRLHFTITFQNVENR